MKRIIYIAILILLFIAFIFSETLLFVTKAELKKTRYELRVEISESSVESMKDLWELREDLEKRLSELDTKLETDVLDLREDLREETWRLKAMMVDLEIRVSRLEKRGET